MEPETKKTNGGFFGGAGDDVQNFFYLIANTLHRKAIGDIKENKIFSGDIKWAGFEEKYFIETFKAEFAIEDPSAPSLLNWLEAWYKKNRANPT